MMIVVRKKRRHWDIGFSFKRCFQHIENCFKSLLNKIGKKKLQLKDFMIQHKKLMVEPSTHISYFFMNNHAFIVNNTTYQPLHHCHSNRIVIATEFEAMVPFLQKRVNSQIHHQLAGGMQFIKSLVQTMISYPTHFTIKIIKVLIRI